MRKRLLPAGLVLLVAILLIPLLKGFVRQVIVVPLLRLHWLGGLLFNSVPQTLFWALFLAVALFMAAKSLIRRRKRTWRAATIEALRPGQVQDLTRRIQYAARGGYFKRELARYLSELLLEVLADYERTTTEQIGIRLSTGGLDVPPEVRALLQAGSAPPFSKPIGFFEMLRHRFRLRAQTSLLDPDLERVVQFLEDRLNVRHDH